MSEISLERLRVLFERGRYRSILRIFHKERQRLFATLEGSSAFEEVLLILTQTLGLLGYHRKAHQILSHAIRVSPLPGLRLSYAESCIDHQNIVKALRTLDKLRERGVSDETCVGTLHSLYAWVYARMGAFGSAESSLARASEYATPQNSEAIARCQFRIYERKKEWTRAEEFVNNFLTEHPSAFSMLLLLALLDARRGKWESAINHFTHASQLAPEAFFPHYHLGYQFLGIGRYQEAGEAFACAKRLAPDNDYRATVAWGIGFSLFEQGERQKALPWFRKARSRDMVRACLNLQLGRSLEESDLKLDVPNLAGGIDKNASYVSYELIEYFKVKNLKPGLETKEQGGWIIPFELRKTLEATKLNTLAFVFSKKRCIDLLQLGIPIVFILTDFEEKRYVLVYGYNYLRECFYIRGSDRDEMFEEELVQKSRSTDGWSLVAFPGSMEGDVRRILSDEEDERFRILEEAESDLVKGKLKLVRRRIISLSPGTGRVTRLKLLHQLQKEIRPFYPLRPSLKIILKSSSNAEADLGFSTRELFQAGEWEAGFNTARRALRFGAMGSAYACAVAQLALGRYSAGLRYNALGLSQSPSHVGLIIQRGVLFKNQADYQEAFRFFRIAGEMVQENAKLFYEIGDTYLLSGDIEQAEAYMKKSVEANPEHSQAWAGLVGIDEARRRLQSAESTCRVALQQNPGKVWSIALLGCFQLRNAFFEDALSTLNEGIKMHPASVSLSLIRLEILEHLQDLELAETDYQELLRTNPYDKLARTHLAIFLTNQQRFDEAFILLKEVLDLDRDFQPALIGLSRWYALNNNLLTAFDLIKRALLLKKPMDWSIDLPGCRYPSQDPSSFSMSASPITPMPFFYQLCTALHTVQEGVNFILSLANDVHAYTHAGYLFEHFDEFDRALRLYEKGLTVKGDHTYVLFRMANIYYKTGDITKAEELYHRVLTHHPYYYGALLSLAFISLEKDEIKGAMDFMEKLLTRYPDHDYSLNAYVEIADTRLQQERARAFLASLMEKADNVAPLLLVRGKIEETENHFESAQQFYEQAMTIDDSFPQTFLRLAVLEIKKGNFERSLHWLDRLSTIQPNHPESLLYRGRVLAKMGKTESALVNALDSLQFDTLDEDLEIDVFDLLADLLDPEQLDISDVHSRNIPPYHFYTLLAEAFERKGDLHNARLLYEASKPFDASRGSYDALIGMTFLSIQTNDRETIDRIRRFLDNSLVEAETHPLKFNPIQIASLNEAIAYIREGERSIEELNESLKHWRSALNLTRTPWALERASYACLDLGELTGDAAYFREALVYLRELRNPLELSSAISPALGDAYYHLGMYHRAIHEYATYFKPEQEDVSFESSFFRYLSALEKTHSPMKDITDLAEEKLESLPSDRSSMHYRRALQDRIFRDYVKTSQHGAALRTAIRSRGFLPGLFRYFKSIIRTG